ncbi:hypothetical protein ACFO3O_00155 [Dokdonia ponticola]|uniref:DUF2867 domain-containing protein n=1 Tax=Dokdonia ponticola TaxID=2041041 RepID=A0ABV9HSQ7_9FLAO
MCQFDGKFLLCTCADDLKEEEVDWKLRRRIPNTSNVETWMLNHPPIELLSSTAGMMTIPDKFKEITAEEIDFHYIQLETLFDSFYENEKKLNKLRSNKKNEYKNIGFHIQLELNRRECFDTPMPFQDKDLLTIRLDKELNVWANFIYKNSIWIITHLLISDKDHKKILYGKIKTSRKA